jgi:hypothetical protein
VVVEWQYRVNQGYGVLVTPVVGYLSEADLVPSVAFTTWAMDYPPVIDTLVALRGDDGEEVFEAQEIYGVADVVIADINGDGEAEIVTTTLYEDSGYVFGEVLAVNADGMTLWSSDAYEYLSLLWTHDSSVSVADLDGDGSVEVVADRYVLAGEDGSLLHELDLGVTTFRAAVVADIDVDGTAEIILGQKVFSHEGSIEWETTYTDGYYTFGAVADVDADGQGEVIFVSNPWLAIHDTDGSLILATEVFDVAPSEPCIADFDGDGDIEIGVHDQNVLSVFETDGSVLWSIAVHDQSCMAGCSAFDFDADGAYEMLFADERRFYLLDGTTGEVLFQWADHDSVTMTEYPVVADVDGDGSAEIVLASNDTQGVDWQGITVFGHADDAWPPAGPTWAHNDYMPLRVHDDGTVPSPTPAPWTAYNMFHARPPGPGRPDLIPILGDSCVASCEAGPMVITYGIGNPGLADVEDPVSISVYAVDGGVETLLQTQMFGGPGYGEQRSAGDITVDATTWGELIRIVVDDDGTGTGTIDECDETNNALELPAPSCE